MQDLPRPLPIPASRPICGVVYSADPMAGRLAAFTFRDDRLCYYAEFTNTDIYVNQTPVMEGPMDETRRVGTHAVRDANGKTTVVHAADQGWVWRWPWTAPSPPAVPDPLPWPIQLHTALPKKAGTYIVVARDGRQGRYIVGDTAIRYEEYVGFGRKEPILSGEVDCEGRRVGRWQGIDRVHTYDSPPSKHT